MTRFHAHTLTPTQRSEFEGLAASLTSTPGYRWLEPGELPSAVPSVLREKLASALMMWEQTSSGATAIICNGVRLDEKDNALDQEAFGVLVMSSGASTGMLFAHHGDWGGRTTPITSGVRTVLESTELGNYFPLGEVPRSSQGPLSDLSYTAHEGAFRQVLEQLIGPRST